MFDNYIVKGIGGFYYVKTGGALVECKPRGIFRKKRVTPVAGDIVRLETDGGTPVIADILPRKNVFVRPPVANVDQFFIVVSTVQPFAFAAPITTSDTEAPLQTTRQLAPASTA